MLSKAACCFAAFRIDHPCVGVDSLAAPSGRAMRNRGTPGQGVRPRDALMALALLGHLFAALGVPLPGATARQAKADQQPFPCQGRPCGCLTAEECWRGDCCCFTLEEKLAWAEAAGIEPPAHVRPLVEARKKQRTHAAKSGDCCSQKHCAADACCHEEKATEPASESQEVRWLVGAFTQKCRGEGPAGLVSLEPSVRPDSTFDHLNEPERAGVVPDRPIRPFTAPRLPPTPPPRQS